MYTPLLHWFWLFSLDRHQAVRQGVVAAGRPRFGCSLWATISPPTVPDARGLWFLLWLLLRLAPPFHPVVPRVQSNSWASVQQTQCLYSPPFLSFPLLLSFNLLNLLIQMFISFTGLGNQGYWGGKGPYPFPDSNFRTCPSIKPDRKSVV